MVQDYFVSLGHYFSGTALDRAESLRSNSGELARLIRDPKARFLPFWRRCHLLSGSVPETRRLARLSGDQLGFDYLGNPEFYVVFLGIEGEAPLFGVDVSPDDNAPRRMAGVASEFVELRPYEFYLSPSDAGLVSVLRGMANWRAGTMFCGVCASRTLVVDGGHRLKCLNGHDHFPRVDPVAVLLVHHGDYVLLASGLRFPNRRLMSALSGFVEAGESVEQAAVREAFEEVGVRTRSIQYHSSQPWPFPGLIMMGFLLEAESMEVAIDPAEIVEARWYSRDDIQNHAALSFDPPDRNTLAGQLLMSWIGRPPAASAGLPEHE